MPLAMAFWTHWTMRFLCFHFPAESRLNWFGKRNVSPKISGRIVALFSQLSTSIKMHASSLRRAGNSGLARTSSRSAEQKRWKTLLKQRQRPSRNTNFDTFQGQILAQIPVRRPGTAEPFGKCKVTANSSWKHTKNELLVQNFGQFLRNLVVLDSSCFD